MKTNIFINFIDSIYDRTPLLGHFKTILLRKIILTRILILTVFFFNFLILTLNYYNFLKIHPMYIKFYLKDLLIYQNFH